MKETFNRWRILVASTAIPFLFLPDHLAVQQAGPCLILC